MAKTKRRWLKKLLVTLLILAIIGAGVYWYVATEKFGDTKEEKASYTVNASDFIHEFQKDTIGANRKYKEKFVTVNGRVSQLESPDSSTVNVKFIDAISGDFVIFRFQDKDLAEAKALTVGDSISVKGSFSAGFLSEILGVIKIDFKRSTLNK